MGNNLGDDNSTLNMLIENFPDLIYWKDKNFIYQGCNKNVSNILGYKTPTDIIGKTDQDLAIEFGWSNNRIRKINEDDKLIIENGIEISEEDSIPFNKKIKIYSTNKKPLYKNGEIIGILGISTDITNGKIIEEELSAAKEKNEVYLHGIVENLPQLVYWKDINFIYQGCNNLCAEMLNLKNPAQIVGKSDNDFGWSKERIDELHDVDRQIITAGIPQVVEDIIPIKNSSRIFLTSKTPLIDKNGNIVGVLGISTDITDRKKMEEELKAAKIAAEAGEKAKDEIIANFSHDMRTPLSGIISDAHQLEEDDISQETRKELAVQLADSGGALLEMFEETLENVAADHMTEKDIELETFDIKLLIDKLIKLEKPSVTQKGLKLLSNIDPNIPQFLVNDRKKIHRILLNLIGNAIKFTKQGHIELKIELIGIHKDQSQVTLKFNVIDTGIGVPEKSKQHLFERFFKGSSSYKAEYKGYGLGLNIAKTYTHLLGGTISFESTEGVGSEFYAILTLKIANEHEIASYQEKIAKKPSLLTMNTNMKLKPTQEHKPATDVKPSETESIPGAPHVLIVEDNLMLRKTTVKLVKKAMLNVTAVDDGLPALELAKNQHFDLILSDVGLLTMSGTEFAQKLRAFEKESNLPTVPIIGVTAHAADGRGECLSAGMNAVTQKPFLKETLVEILKQFLPDHKLPKN